MAHDCMNLQTIVGLALKVSIMLTLFGFGLQATRDDLLYLLRRPGVLVRSLVAMLVVMPVFAILMTRFVSFDRAVVIALIALSISPVPPVLPTKVTKSGGHPPYGLGLMVTAASFSIVYVPLAVYLAGKYFNRPFAMGPGAVAELIVISILVPLAAGIAFRKVAPTIAGASQVLLHVLRGWSCWPAYCVSSPSPFLEFGRSLVMGQLSPSLLS
jgi:BASS family bile acid:Na+ symporter